MATAPPLPTHPANPPPSPIQTGPNLVHFDPKLVVPSQTIYLQRNDFLGFNLLTNLTAAVVHINYRWLTPEGDIKEGEIDTPPFSGSNFQEGPLYEGWLLSFAARVTSGFVAGGWCFMQALIFRTGTASAATNPHAVFWQGFVNNNASNGWPGTLTKEITDGAGTLRSILGTLPGAGVDILETVPTQRRWTLLSFRASLQTSAAVATRQVQLALDDSVNGFFSVECINTQVASLTIFYNFAASLVPNSTYNAEFQSAIPSLMALKSTFRIRTSTISIQAGDQWSAPRYLVLEWGNWDT